MLKKLLPVIAIAFLAACTSPEATQPAAETKQCECCKDKKDMKDCCCKGKKGKKQCKMHEAK